MSTFNSNISYIIKQLLREGKQVYLPNIGTLYPVKESAKMIPGSNRIAPPKCDFLFNEAGKENGNLINRLLTNKLASLTNVEQIIQDYSSDLFKEIYNNGTSNISGVGSISADGENVSFEYDKSLVDNHYTQLKPVFVKPTKTAMSKKQSKVTKKQVKETSDWALVGMGLLLGAVLLGLLALGKYFFFSDGDSTIDPVEMNKPSMNSFNGAQTMVLDTIESYTEKVDYVVNDQTKTITHNYVIVTGSLTKGQNVEEMVDLLEKLNYNVITKEHQNLTRVGVLLSCDEIDVNQYLDEIKQKISDDAWILEKES